MEGLIDGSRTATMIIGCWGEMRGQASERERERRRSNICMQSLNDIGSEVKINGLSRYESRYLHLIPTNIGELTKIKRKCERSFGEIGTKLCKGRVNRSNRET